MQTLKETIKKDIEGLNMFLAQNNIDDDNPRWYGKYSLCGATSGHLAAGNPNNDILVVDGVHVLTCFHDVVAACLELGGRWYHHAED